MGRSKSNLERSAPTEPPVTGRGCPDHAAQQMPVCMRISRCRRSQSISALTIVPGSGRTAPAAGRAGWSRRRPSRYRRRSLRRRSSAAHRYRRAGRRHAHKTRCGPTRFLPERFGDNGCICARQSGLIEKQTLGHAAISGAGQEPAIDHAPLPRPGVHAQEPMRHPAGLLRQAASVSVQSKMSRCAWLPPIRKSSKRTGCSRSTTRA